MNFNLNDRVKTNGKFSPIIFGKIIGIYLSAEYLSMNPPEVQSILLNMWNTHYPQWKTKLAYLIQKDSPSVSAYHENAPILLYTIYLEDELESLKWINTLEKEINENRAGS